MKRSLWKFFIVMGALLIGPSLLLAQAPDAIKPDDSMYNMNPEKQAGGYAIHQSFEFGYRFTSIDTDTFPGTNLMYPGMYNTLVNLHSGPRLLEQTLSMQSLAHTGVLFDDLYLSSYGFGGDPNEVARLRVAKYRWYDFTGLFRRDWNYFDYNLLANPLNPPTSTPSVPIFSSPKAFNSARRMTDLNLTLAPESRVSVRLGYSKNSYFGPTMTTIPEASEAELIETELVQHNHTSSDTYTAGIDFKVLPKTTFSFDETVVHTKTDPLIRDESFAFVLPGSGTPVDLGIVWDSLNGYPCAVPFNPAPPAASDTCALYVAYTRRNPYRSTAPTEAFRFQSNYIPRLKLNGGISYTGLNMTGSFADFFNGFLPDLTVRQFTTIGPVTGTRIATNADFGVTLEITKRWRIVDRFHFYRYGIPSSWNSIMDTWLGASASTPVGATPDMTDNTIFTRFLGENVKSNEIAVQYDFSRMAGAELGYRLQQATYHHFDELNDVTAGDVETGDDIIDVNSHTALLGLWFRPNDRFRANFDGELTSSDNFLTRISPRRQFRYRFRSVYRLNKHVTASVSADVTENRNGISDIKYNSHFRNFGGMVVANASDRLNFEASYNYNNVASSSFICFQSDPSAITAASGFCAADAPDLGAPFQYYEVYKNQEHYGSFMLIAKPVKRLTTKLGYSVVSSDGNIPELNVLAPFGSLKSTFHRPTADVEVDVSHGVAFFVRWNYFDYGEKDPYFGPTAPRNFHGNLSTVGFRYSF